MFDLPQIVTRISSETGLVTDIAEEEQPSLLSKDSPAKVFVGYLSEMPGDEMSAYTEQDREGLEQFGELTVETISVQILTTMDNLIADKNKVKASLLGWSPDETNSELSGFTSFGGSVLALNNGRVHWAHTYGITYPTL